MANRYWVGGTAQWDASALRWSATSGGPGGAGEPTSADDVFFDANSGTGTCTISGNREAKSINFTGYTGTLAGGASVILNVFGNVTFSSGMTVNLNSASDIRFKASATLISAGKTLGFVMVEGAGITLTLGDSLTASTESEFNLKEGTLNLNNYNLSTGVFQSTTGNTRSISFGSGNIALTSTTATTVLIMGNAAGFSWTGTGGFTRNQASTATVQFGSTGGGTASNAPNLTVNAGSSALTITSGSYFKNLNFTGSTCTVTATYNACGNLTLATGGTYTSVVPTFIASGTVTSAGKTLGNTTVSGSGITVTLADAMTLGTSNTFTLTQGALDLAGFTLSTGNFSSNNSNTRSIAFGTGKIVITTTTAGGTSINMSNMSGFSSTFSGGPFGPTGGFYRNQVSETTFNIGTSNKPSNANAFNLQVTGSATLTFATTSKVRTLDFSPDFMNATCTVIGGCEFSANCSLSSSATYTSFSLTATGTGILTSRGKTINNFTVADELIAGTDIVEISGVLTVANSVSLNNGTFQTNGHAINAVSFQSTNSNIRTLNMGGSVITLSGSGSAVWNCATSLNLTVTGTGSIVLNSASAKTFAGGGKTYPTLRNAGAGALTISGNNTFTTIENTVQPTTFTFTSGTTQTVTNFNVNGTLGNLVTINSTTPGSQATLSKASGQVLANFLSLQDNNATGGAEWFLKSGVRGGNVSGWYVNQAMMAWFF